LETIRRKIGLEPDEIQAFAEAAEKMYLPYDETLGINPQDDSFLSKKRWDIERTPRDHFPLLLHYHPLYLYRHQICKQADTVMAHFVFEDAQSRETIRRSFLYYEGVSAHDSSLSTCIFSIVASRLGYHEKAYRYFGDSAKLDLFDAHGNTKDGIHTANMGGTYMAILYGFAGLRLKETGLYFFPHLPASWTAYRFRILYRGSSIQAEIGPEEIRFTLLSGDKQIIHVYDREYVLAASLVLSPPRETPKYRAVIFDLDGVLVSTDRQHYRAWETIAAELGIPFDEKLNDRLRGVSRMASLEIILKSGGLVLEAEKKAALAERKNRMYRQLLNELDHASVDAATTETLGRLKAAGIKLAVGSSSKNARFILEKTGLAPYFDAVAGGEDITRPKPDPEVFLKAAAMLGTAAADTLVVEDAPAGIAAASDGGFDSAALGAARSSPRAVYGLESLSALGDILIRKPGLPGAS
jgi:alpha,alpha-trehalose phosphorylase